MAVVVRETSTPCACAAPSPTIRGVDAPALAKDLGTILLALVAAGGIWWWYHATQWAPVRRR